MVDTKDTKGMKQCLAIVAIMILLIGSIIGIVIAEAVHLMAKSKPETVVIEQKSPIENEYLGEFEVTYYIATGNRTSTGVYPKSDRTIAVDPKVIPYGTIVYIEGIGARIAEDCGGAVRNNVIDVFVDTTHQEAIKMGRKKLKVYKILNQ